MMAQTLWNDIDTYYNDLFLENEPALVHALNDSEKAGLDPIAVAPNQGKFLNMMARIHGAKRILEIGTLGGYSTIWLARAVSNYPDGKVISLELDPQCVEIAQKNIDRAGLTEQVEIRQGAALETLDTMISDEEAPFDLIFIDADKENNAGYFQATLKLARKGTLIIVDNVIRKGEVINAHSTDTAVQGVRKFNEVVSKEPRVTTTVMQTVGSKGYDGLAFILVTAG